MEKLCPLRLAGPRRPTVVGLFTVPCLANPLRLSRGADNRRVCDSQFVVWDGGTDRAETNSPYSCAIVV